jgi:hypothetical protein
LGRHASISGSSLTHCASVSIAPSSFQEGQNARNQNRFKLEQTLALQLQSTLISDLLGHHDSEIMDGGWVGRDDVGAVGVVVAGGQGSDQAVVPAGADGGLSRAVPRSLLGPERRKTGWMRAIAAGVSFGWVVADTVYGTGEVEMALRPRAGAGSIVDHLEGVV